MALLAPHLGVLEQNIALALGIEGVFLVCTLLGTSLLVIAIGLRLLRQRWG